MPQRVLLVEDEHVLREINKEYFINAGYEVIEAENGNEALLLFEQLKIDLIILDIMLPELDGWSVCKTIRQKSVVPIIMLTALSDEEDTVLGFELGADDYVTKPFSPRVLLARAKRLLNLQVAHIQTEKQEMLFSNQLEVNLHSRLVKVEGIKVELTHTEFEILTYLMKNKNAVISREQLIMKIWGYEYNGDDRTLNTHILNLRKKLGSKANYIKTIIRSGYKFEEQKG